MTFLDEQLNQIYLTEDITKIGAQFKSKLPALNKALSNGNLIQARELLNRLPEISPEELVLIAQKKNRAEYIKAAKLIKGDKTLHQKLFCVTYASITGIQKSLPADKKASLDEILEQLRDFANKYGDRFAREGLSLFFTMFFIAFFVSASPILFNLAISGIIVSIAFMWISIFLVIVRIYLNSYFSLKGKK